MYIDLDDEELALLNGNVKSADAMVKVAAAVARVAMRALLREQKPEVADFIANVLLSAKTTGKIQFHSASMRSCTICKAGGGYALWKKSRYHKTGSPNLRKPILLYGVRLCADAICCNRCWHETVKDALKPIVADLEYEIHKDVLDAPPRYRTFDRVSCKECQWKGDRRGDRHIHECPHCDSGGRLIDDGFMVVDIEAEAVVDGLAVSPKMWTGVLR